jgi:hypothetical protein
MWVILSLLSLLCVILVPAAVYDLKVRRRNRRARLANPYEYKDHRQQPWKARTMSGVHDQPGGAASGSVGGGGIGGDASGNGGG